MARIVLNTFGSFGDLHPYLALAIELAFRGHRPLIATSAVYRAKVEAEGIEFAPVRPDVGELLGNEQLLNKLWHPRSGGEYLLRDYVLPKVEASFEDLAKACIGADLLVTHAAAYAGPVVAEVLRLRWISIALQPAILFSATDPSVIAQAPWAKHLYPFGFFRLLLQAGRWRTARWAAPVAKLRRRLKLPPGANPVIEGQFSPHGTLALFSRHFDVPQPDWPAKTTATGFVSYDKRGVGFGTPVDSGLQQFLAAGPAPVLFTLGSSAVMAAGSFYLESIKAVQQLGVRALMLIGMADRASYPAVDPGQIHFADYIPYSQVMPRAAAIVHQGGIGTMAQALKAGKPTIIVPWAFDQPDNAERCRKLGVSRTINRASYRADRVARELNLILHGESYLQNARALAAKLSAENGLQTACDALEGLLANWCSNAPPPDSSSLPPHAPP